MLLKGIFKKKFHNFGIDIVNLLTGMDIAGVTFKGFIESLDLLLKRPTVTCKSAL